MKKGLSKSIKGSGKPVKRVSKVKKKRTGSDIRHLLRRTWWVLRGAVAGVLILGLIYGVYLGAGKVLELDSLSVRSIEVEGCNNIQPESIRRLAGVMKGTPLLKVDLNRVRRKVVTHPSVLDATVVRELPDILRISVKERTPAAVVLDREFALVDTEGVIMSLHSSYPEGYPIITGVPGSREPGDVVVDMKPALEVLQKVSRSGVIGTERISEIHVDGKVIRVSLMDGGTVIVLGPGNKDSQIGKLARLMEAGVFDTRSGGYDLRFGDRVIGMPDRKGYTKKQNGIFPAGG